MNYLKTIIRAWRYQLQMVQGYSNSQLKACALLLLGITALHITRVGLRAYFLVEEEEQLAIITQDAPVKAAQQGQSASMLPQKSGNPTNSAFKKVKRTEAQRYTYDLNMADSSTLESLPGIGPVLAARIIKFRDKLGGFYQIGQLKEVWGLDTTLADKLALRLFITGDFKPKCIDLSRADVKDLQAHPYISAEEAYAIVKFRKEKGELCPPATFANILVNYKKLRPYLCDTYD